MALTLDGTSGIVSSGAISSSSNITATGSITTQSATGIIFSDSSSLPAASSPYVLKNRIINGDMRIDQRNAGASVTPSTGTYTVDRWRAYQNVASKFTVQQVSGNANTAQGFDQSLRITSSSAYTPTGSNLFLITQNIEGYNISDLSWGTASAKTVTLSFWVYSSLTGTFGGSLVNASENLSYPFTYTISLANTWEQKTITVAGPTTGTWDTTNGVGIEVNFGIGAGSTYQGTAGSWQSGAYFTATGTTNIVATNGATWYLVGVQLERGSTATPFERRMFSQELVLCQRYYEKGFDVGVAPSSTYANYWQGGGLGAVAFGTNVLRSINVNYVVDKRATPTITLFNPSGLGSAGSLVYYNGSWGVFTTGSIEQYSGTKVFNIRSTASGTTGNTYIIDGSWTASAE